MKHSERIELSDTIKEALTQLRSAKNRGLMTQITQDTGISLSQLSKYASGMQKTMPLENWEKLHSAIKPYLPNGFDPRNLNQMPEISKQSHEQKEEIVLKTFTPGQQIITGVINVYGVPNEKIIEAIKTTNLSETQRDELRRKIFS